MPDFDTLITVIGTKVVLEPEVIASDEYERELLDVIAGVPVGPALDILVEEAGLEERAAPIPDDELCVDLVTEDNFAVALAELMAFELLPRDEGDWVSLLLEDEEPDD